MKRWQDWAIITGKSQLHHGYSGLLNAMLRHRLMAPEPHLEAERDGIPFTPIWWWWNAEADEYVLTLWDTEARKQSDPPMYSFGASDPLGTFGQPTTMLVPGSVVKQARKILTVRKKP